MYKKQIDIYNKTGVIQDLLIKNALNENIFININK